MTRGYTLNRGKGQQRKQIKRGRCPECGKLGVGPWKATNLGFCIRECRYCHHVRDDRPKFDDALRDAQRALAAPTP
jgi:hypothetical protein